MRSEDAALCSYFLLFNYRLSKYGVATFKVKVNTQRTRQFEETQDIDTNHYIRTHIRSLQSTCMTMSSYARALSHVKTGAINESIILVQ